MEFFVGESLGKIYHRGHGNVIDPASWSVRFWYPAGGSPAAVTTGGPKPTVRKDPTLIEPRDAR